MPLIQSHIQGVIGELAGSITGKLVKETTSGLCMPQTTFVKQIK